jgi:hypothetical protein
VFVTEQIPFPCLFQHFLEKPLRHLLFEQAIPVLGECTGIPHPFITV